jgi:2'-5' RNA ligase
MISESDAMPSAPSQTPQDGLRLFLALRFDKSTHDKIVDLSERLQKGARFTPVRFTWTPPSNLHLTLYFIGNLNRQAAGQLQAELPAAVAHIPPFELDVRRLGYFPEDTRVAPPTVLWIGIHNPPAQLTALREALLPLLKRRGIVLPAQDYKPHVTLARIKSTKGLNDFRRIARDYEFWKCGDSAIDEVTLMESLTGEGMAVHRPIAAAPLTGAVAE